MFKLIILSYVNLIRNFDERKKNKTCLSNEIEIKS